MLELLFSLVIGWNLVTVEATTHPQEFVTEQECVTALWWWDGDEWRGWFTSQPFIESDFFVTLPESYQEEHGRDAWSEYWLSPGEAYWVYCEDDAIQHR